MINLKTLIGGAGPVGTERWFHNKAPSPMYTLDGAVYLRSGNILINDAANYPEAFAKFKVSQATAWAAITSFTGSVLSFVEYLNGEWWAGGASGVLFKSQDGLTWSSVSHPMGTGFTLTGMAYGNGTYVITVGLNSSTQCLYSTDGGVTWTKCTAYTSGIFNAVTYFKGYFIAVGNAGRGMRSTDGINWYACNTNFSTSYNIVAIANDGKRFWAIGSTFMVGSDAPASGLWTVASHTFTNALNDIECGDGRWIAVAASGQYQISYDGVIWNKPILLVPIGTRTNVFAVCYGSGEWVLGCSNSTFYKIVFNSNNVPTVTGPFAALNPKAISYGEGVFLAIGQTAVAPQISAADSVGMPTEIGLAGGEVIKYMRVK